MTNLKTGASALALLLAAGQAGAAGLDRSGQSILPIFAEDNTVALSFGVVIPSVTGEDIDGTGGSGDYDVGETYHQTGLSYTNAVNDRLNYSLIFDQPYGADVAYDADPLTSNLGGTGADLDAEALSFVMRYKLGERFSVFGGIKGERVSADVNLNGLAYRGAIATGAVARGFNEGLPAGAPALDRTTLGAALAGSPDAAASIDGTYGAGTTAALGAQVASQGAAFAATDGYAFEMEDDTKLGYVLGFAYEIPAIALRFSAAYSPEIEHDGEITETIFGSTFENDIDYVTPASLNLDFQTGIAPGTLALASYRWTDFSEVSVVPTVLGSDLIDLDDAHRFSVGLGRAFTKSFAGSVQVIYEPDGDRDTVSPLGPTDGLWGLTMGGRYSSGGLNVSGGVNYSWLGDADAGVAGRPVASFEDNHAVGVGLRGEFTF